MQEAWPREDPCSPDRGRRGGLRLAPLKLAARTRRPSCSGTSTLLRRAAGSSQSGGLMLSSPAGHSHSHSHSDSEQRPVRRTMSSAPRSISLAFLDGAEPRCSLFAGDKESKRSATTTTARRTAPAREEARSHRTSASLAASGRCDAVRCAQKHTRRARASGGATAPTRAGRTGLAPSSQHGRRARHQRQRRAHAKDTVTGS
jgi:hypothetical protein